MRLLPILLTSLIATNSVAETLTGDVRLAEPIVVQRGKTLTIKEAKLELVEHGSILLEGGTLEVQESEIISLAPSPPADASFDDLTLVAISGFGVVRITKLDFKAQHPYSTTVLCSTAQLSGYVEDSTITNAHGGLHVHHAHTFRAKRNRIHKTSGGAIAVSGENVEISRNFITFPGAGITGDGIALGDVKHATIYRNTIVSGTCYGLWLNANEAEDVTISSNTIASGITSGIYVSKKSEDARIENILIEDNSLLLNSGFGISIEAPATVIGNILHGNAPAFPAQIHVAKGVTATVENNVVSIPVDAEWAKHMSFGRRNWTTDDTVYIW